MQRVASTDLDFVDGKDSLREYGSRDFSRHFFCSSCGIYVYTHLIRRGCHAVNLQCVDDIDIEALSLRRVDGKNTL